MAVLVALVGVVGVVGARAAAVRPVLELLLVVLQSHQRRKQAVARAASMEHNIFIIFIPWYSLGLGLGKRP